MDLILDFIKDIFFKFYEFVYYDVFGVVLYELSFLVALILFFVTLIFGFLYMKQKFHTSILLKMVVLLIFIGLYVYQSLPFYFVSRSMFSDLYEEKIDFLEKAQNYSIFSWEKGALYARIGDVEHRYNNSKLAIQDYDLAYSCIRTYKYKKIFANTYEEFLKIQDYDNALRVAEDFNDLALITEVYVKKKDFHQALLISKSDLYKNEPSPKRLAMQSYIYKNLSDGEEARKKYNVAQKMCNDQKECNLKEIEQIAITGDFTPKY